MSKERSSESMATPLMDERVRELADGTRVEIRPCGATSSDCGPDCLKAGIGDAFERLSPRSRELRFAAGLQRLSDSQLSYLSNLDNRDRLAWCAIEPIPDGHRGIGLARYVRLEESPAIAEFAVTVVDAYQGRGIGRILLGRLIESARENGLETLRGYILPSNSAMLRLAERFGARLSSEDEFVRADIEVDSAGREPDTH